MTGRKLYEAQRTLIDEVIRFICGRHRLRGDEAEDFTSSAHVKLLTDDCAILRKFEGRCSLRTYLVTVLHRHLLDYRIQKWGKWRPSARARALGPAAVELERLTHRDGRSVSEAIEILQADERIPSSRRELEDMAGRLPQRLRRRVEGGETVEHLPSAVESAERTVLEREREEARVQAEAALAKTMQTLSYRERLILKMRFNDGFEVAQIARALQLEAKPLYNRIEKSLRAIRKALEGEGLRRQDIVSLLESTGWQISINYNLEQGNPEGSPSKFLEDRSTG